MEGVGDHAAVEDVLGGERPPPEVDGLGVDVAVVADGGGNSGEGLRSRAVDLHVPARDERELSGREHAEAHHEFVGRTGPWRGGRALGVRPGGACGDENGAGEAGGDGRGGLEHRGDARAGHRAPHWSDAVLVDEVGRTAAADHAVDVARGQAGIGDGTECRLHGDGAAVVTLEHAGLARVVDPCDGHVVERVVFHPLLPAVLMGRRVPLR